jgi:hypothetical protein
MFFPESNFLSNFLAFIYFDPIWIIPEVLGFDEVYPVFRPVCSALIRVELETAHGIKTIPFLSISQTRRALAVKF